LSDSFRTVAGLMVVQRIDGPQISFTAASDDLIMMTERFRGPRWKRRWANGRGKQCA
jgi:hypothetical protein